MAFVDVELMLTTYIRTRQGCTAAVDVPANLVAAVPVAVVRRIAGADTILTLDQAVVDVDVYAADRAAARLLSDQIRSDFRLHLSGYVFGGGVVAKVETSSGPVWVPYDNTNVRRYTATYRVTVHSAP
jgi:hypothetical protein